MDLRLPPQWAPDGVWIAFLMGCSSKQGKAVELFVGKADGTEVQALSHGGNRVVDTHWLDKDNLVYSERRADGTGALYRVALADPQPEPVLLTTIAAPN